MYEKIYENNSKILEITKRFVPSDQYNIIFNLLHSSLYDFNITYEILEKNLSVKTEEHKVQEELISDLISKYNELNLQLTRTNHKLDNSEFNNKALKQDLQNFSEEIDELNSNLADAEAYIDELEENSGELCDMVDEMIDELTVELHDNPNADDIDQLEQNLVARLSEYIKHQLTPELTQSIKKDLTEHLQTELSSFEDKINKSLERDQEVPLSKQKIKYTDNLDKPVPLEEDRKIFYIDIPNSSDVINLVEKFKEKLKERNESGLINPQEFDNIVKLAKEIAEKY